MDPIGPKPELRKIVDRIQSETRFAVDALEVSVGPILYTAELIVRQTIARAVEAGIEMQREATREWRERSDEITKKIRRPADKRFTPPRK